MWEHINLEAELDEEMRQQMMPFILGHLADAPIYSDYDVIVEFIVGRH